MLFGRNLWLFKMIVFLRSSCTFLRKNEIGEFVGLHEVADTIIQALIGKICIRKLSLWFVKHWKTAFSEYFSRLLPFEISLNCDEIGEATEVMSNSTIEFFGYIDATLANLIKRKHIHKMSHCIFPNSFQLYQLQLLVFLSLFLATTLWALK